MIDQKPVYDAVSETWKRTSTKIRMFRQTLLHLKQVWLTLQSLHFSKLKIFYRFSSQNLEFLKNSLNFLKNLHWLSQIKGSLCSLGSF